MAGVIPTSEPGPTVGTELAHSRRQGADGEPRPRGRTLRRSGPRRISALACTAAVALLTAACSSSAATSSTTRPPAHPTSHHHVVGVTGKIHSVSSSALVIDVHRTPKTVTLTSNTTYRQGSKTVTAGALKDGERVRVQGQPGPSASFAATKVIVVSGGA